MNGLPSRPPGPQPVLDHFLETDGGASQANGQPDHEHHHASGSRLDAAQNLRFPLNRSSTHLLGSPMLVAQRDRSESPIPRPGLLRAKSDFGPRREQSPKQGDTDSKTSGDGEWGIRHGFEMQLVSEEYNNLLTSNFFLYFTDKKHETGGNPKPSSYNHPLQEWRMRDRLKTVAAVLALCLNIGVDPPDVIKTNPSSKLECWFDPASPPSSYTGGSPLNHIGKELQKQYEQLSMRTRYKCALDPTVEETRKFATGLRKNARNERVLFHYNGHGVPKPTSSGEIWVFNRNYTQYIPISLYDLQSWVGGPSIFVWDCSDAGLITQNFLKFADKHAVENNEILRRDPEAEVTDYTDCIHLAACREKETLPSNPDMPADMFTSCLTTPIWMAVRFFLLQNPLPSDIPLEYFEKIPGAVSERRTPLGELNWIFTAITDTIAWDVLPKPLFKKLFRQDLMVAALYRNFLLSQRIMRHYHCHPQCYPELPPTHDHPLWQSWDLAIETILAQLPDLLAAADGLKVYEYQHSTFFAEQLTAFEVYLQQDAAEEKIPEQLPVVLQVLLSQVHRLRALVLLSKFLDLGPWAVNLALGIGIFPYVLKLLQSQAMELKPVMVFIWARILAVDQSCQADLLKDNGYQYFIQILNPTGPGKSSFLSVEALDDLKPSRELSDSRREALRLLETNKLLNPGIQGVANVSEHRAMCAFIIAMFCKEFENGRHVCLSQELIESCLSYFNDVQNPLLRQWSCLCLSMLWVKFPEAKWVGIKCSAHQRLCDLVVDCVAEVRAAMLHALTSFIGIPDLTPQVAQIEASIASMVLIMASDGNTMVRKELLVFFSTFIVRYQNRFLVAAYEQLREEKGSAGAAAPEKKEDRNKDVALVKTNGRSAANGDEDLEDGVSANTIFAAVWKEVLIMSVDPHPELAENACIVVDYILEALLASPLGQHAQPLMDTIIHHQRVPSASSSTSRYSYVEVPLPSNDRSRPTTPPTPTKTEGYLTASLKRTASVAASLKNMAFGPSPSSHESSPRSGKSPLADRTLGPRSKKMGELNRPPDEKDNYHVPSAYPSLKAPRPRGYQPGTTKQSMPLQSKFFDWSVEYFREPQMKPPEADEPGSTDYNERLWRRNRNDRIIAKTQPQKDMAGGSAWDKQKGFWNNGTQPVKLCWHQFEDQLIVTDDRDGVAIWDWKRQVRLNRFSNGNPTRSRMTEVRLINEDDQAFLMTGSSDGVVKLFRNYESPGNVELVTSFRALTDLEPSNKNAGLVFDWQQSRGQILVAGDVRSIRVWNAGTEICTSDINARSGSPITSLTSDQVEGNLFIAGFGDGALRLYDQRQKPQTALVHVWKEHKAWVTNVHLQRGGQRELISACRNGEVKLWDIRMDKSIRTIEATPGLRVLAVHEHAPVFAVGTEGRQVKIFNTSGKSLSHFDPYSTRFIGGVGGISAVAFHPHRMIVAGAAVGDSHVNVFGCGKKGDKEI